jgi:uncharacterized membrane protein
MKGDVLGFDRDSNTGAISGEDGRRYDFVTLDWRGRGSPRRGDTVDFVAAGQRATEIYPLALRHDPHEGETANLVYILYLASLVVGITGIVGLVIAYVNRRDAPDWLQSHYRVQIRTFWIGLLYAFIGLLTLIVIVGAIVWAFAFVWWIVRCAKGLRAISRGEPYDRPATWLW